LTHSGRASVPEIAQGGRQTADSMAVAFWETAMNARIRQLRDLVVALDRADRNLDAVDADAYRAAARQALALTQDEMGLLPMSDFAGPANALQNMAENIYFAVNGCFADLDGSGRAPQAQTAAKALLCNVGVTADATVREVAARLFDRLAGASTDPPTSAAKTRAVGTKP
jgi:hypothetical protein